MTTKGMSQMLNTKVLNAKPIFPRAYEGMEKLLVCFDVDGTLITNAEYVPKNADAANKDIVELLKILSRFKNIRIVVWSGGGKDYAEMWGNRLKLDKYVWRYASKMERDELRQHGRIIAIDDIQHTAIGDINLIVRQK